MRRYMCSYNSPTFLFQPIELISLAAIARLEGFEVQLLDAIAENLTSQQVRHQLKDFQPKFIVSLTGFECIEEDIHEIEGIKSELTQVQTIIFGHYAGVFKKALIQNKFIDFIIDGEPDLTFKELLCFFKGQQLIKDIHGISYTKAGNFFHNENATRIINPNELPIPAFDLLQNHLYSEPFFESPYGLIQSARGCPYQCNFCVKSYGTKLTMLTPENIVLQLEKYISLFGIKSFRFIDDTFTAVPSRVIEFCKLMLSKRIKLKWSCLVRPDTLDKDMLEWMKKAGCVRLYVGVESGSQKIIHALNKKFNIQDSLKNCLMAKKMGYQLMGFFMVGHPLETIFDVKESSRFAIRAGFSFIVVSTLTPYPGTVLYTQFKDDIDFSLIPYINQFKSKEIRQKAITHQKYFTRRFYFHPKTWLTLSSLLYTDGWSLIKNLILFLQYLIFTDGKRKRKDYI